MAAEDLRQILALLAAYGRTLDTQQWDDHAALYADDCHLLVFESDYAGRGSILEFLKGARRGKHITAVPSVVVQANRATSASDYVFFEPDCTLFNAGRYDDELVRERGAWRFARRTITIDFRRES